MNEFDRVLALFEAYQTAKLEFRAAEKEAREITQSVSERLVADKAAVAERMETLQKRVDNPSLPDGVRRMGQVELAALQEREFHVFPEEHKMFEERVQEAERLSSDMEEILLQMREGLKSLTDKATQLRRETLGDQSDAGQRKNWIDSRRREFAALSR